MYEPLEFIILNKMNCLLEFSPRGYFTISCKILDLYDTQELQDHHPESGTFDDTDYLNSKTILLKRFKKKIKEKI